MTLMGKIVFIYYFILLVLPRVYSLTLKKTSVLTLYLLIVDEADAHANNGNYPHTLLRQKMVINRPEIKAIFNTVIRVFVEDNS